MCRRARLSLFLLVTLAVGSAAQSCRRCESASCASTPAGAAPKPKCNGQSSLPGDLRADGSSIVERKMEHQCETRRYYVTLPAGFDNTVAKKAPVLIMLHGLNQPLNTFTSNNPRRNAFGKLQIPFIRKGGIGVIPVGAESGAGCNSWNAGPGAGCCVQSFGPAKCADDMTFLEKMLNEIQRDLCIDTGRIFMHGVSLGSMMAYETAYRLSDRIAKIVPRSGYPIAFRGIGNVGRNGFPTPSKPTPIVHFHGLQDRFNNPKGGGLYFSRDKALEAYAKLNGCSCQSTSCTRPYSSAAINQGFECYSYGDCPGGDVVFCGYQGGHLRTNPEFPDAVADWLLSKSGTKSPGRPNTPGGEPAPDPVPAPVPAPDPAPVPVPAPFPGGGPAPAGPLSDGIVACAKDSKNNFCVAKIRKTSVCTKKTCPENRLCGVVRVTPDSAALGVKNGKQCTLSYCTKESRALSLAANNKGWVICNGFVK